MTINEMRLRVLAHDIGLPVTELADGPALVGETFMEQRDLPSGLSVTQVNGQPAIVAHVNSFKEAA